MQYKLTLLAVKDVEVSKRFYTELFDQEVVLDLGCNVTFSGGFAIQQEFAWLVHLPPGAVVEKSNNVELYFEVDDFDQFLTRLGEYQEIEYVHLPKKHDWQQRVVRIYDPDFHIIEIGESKTVIANRYLTAGYSVEETAAIIQHPVEFVERVKSL
ncbi:MAG: glyoxalase/bleomycin resistance/dioxygenase family protein [Firmicutes bacterium]|nr:glyoxalase/bleomycin resistance/dioxygenase family protein [Bacillota bacterium]NLO65611.1 glyoxalase/bleomycin resistance/dioxygenase family protein [Bacillota bacterium]